MINKRPLNKHALDSIAELSEKYGIKADLEESLWLDRLGQNIDNPPGGSNLHLIGRPARCGDVTLWPLTIGASIWWQECGGVWFNDHKIETYVFGYCLAHAREPDKLLACCDYKTTKIIVKDWAKSLGVTVEELEACFVSIGESTDAGEPPQPKKPLDVEDNEIGARKAMMLDAVAELALCYGGGLDYWTWDLDRDTAIYKLGLSRMVEKAQGPMASAPLPDPNNPIALAIRCRRAAIVSIIESRGYTIDESGIALAPDNWKSEV